MADTTAATGLTVQQWDDKFFVEYQGNHPFKPYMGTSEQSIIQINEQLGGKKGDAVTFALLNKLTGAGVSGTATLEGNEEDMESRSFVLNVDKYRNAVRVPEMEEQRSAISLRNAARPNLMEWAKQFDTDRIVAALQSINGVAYGSASAAQKNAWLVDNADRVLFGDARGNGGYTTHSTDLATVTAGMTLDTGILSLMKRMALTANPKIRPVRLGNLNRRYYVAFVHPLAMRDLKADSVLTQAQREVQITSQNEKIFQGGDVDYDGILIHECDDMPILSGVGASGADVSPVFLCGAQALGHARVKRWRSVEETFDYGDKKGVAVETIDGIGKIVFGTGSGDTDDLKDHGVVTGYVATAADA
ncbi:N4-gp56 family major capsid protein [Sphingomicrobium sp. XHP0235]|uniref:N4-gp56 family major capsid protein n=1 Tax=Sphingomicrobium aquimarinum TaxID=3133971 RepID=UPI0031FF28F3